MVSGIADCVVRAIEQTDGTLDTKVPLESHLEILEEEISKNHLHSATNIVESKEFNETFHYFHINSVNEFLFKLASAFFG